MIRILALLLTLSGCAPLATQPSWPSLPVSIHRIPDGEVYAKCARATPWWAHILFFPVLPLGCAERTAEGTCIIWLGETSSDAVLEHELQHCRGYDHIF